MRVNHKGQAPDRFEPRSNESRSPYMSAQDQHGTKRYLGAENGSRLRRAFVAAVLPRLGTFTLLGRAATAGAASRPG
jgi:hypothetical protein